MVWTQAVRRRNLIKLPYWSNFMIMCNISLDQIITKSDMKRIMIPLPKKAELLIGPQCLLSNAWRDKMHGMVLFFDFNIHPDLIDNERENVKNARSVSNTALG